MKDLRSQLNLLQEHINTESNTREQKDNELNEKIDDLITANQVWLTAVEKRDDLADPETLDRSFNYLCRVINDDEKENNGVWQLIITADNWTYFSDNLDFVDETELLEVITEHNENTQAHSDIRQALVKQDGTQNQILTKNSDTSFDYDWKDIPTNSSGATEWFPNKQVNENDNLFFYTGEKIEFYTSLTTGQFWNFYAPEFIKVKTYELDYSDKPFLSSHPAIALSTEINPYTNQLYTANDCDTLIGETGDVNQTINDLLGFGEYNGEFGKSVPITLSAGTFQMKTQVSMLPSIKEFKIVGAGKDKTFFKKMFAGSSEQTIYKFTGNITNGQNQLFKDFTADGNKSSYTTAYEFYGHVISPSPFPAPVLHPSSAWTCPRQRAL